MVDYTRDDIFTLAQKNQNPYNLFPYGNIDTGFNDLTSGQGNISNVRHAVGTSLARDYIASLLDPFYEANKATGNEPWWGARWAGNTGAWLTGAVEEIGDAYRSYSEGNPKWYVQPWEDVLANTMGLKEANYYTDADEKAKTMTKAYADDEGIMNVFLQKLSEDNPNVLRQKDLQKGIVPGSGSVGQRPVYVNPHPHFLHRDMPIWRGGNPNWDRPYDDGPTWKQINSKENAIAGGAAGAGNPYSVRPKFNMGGIASLWHR